MSFWPERSSHIHATALQGVAATISRYGGNPIDILRAFDIRSSRTSSCDAAVEFEKLTHLFEYCADIFKSPHFALDVAKSLSPSVLGPIPLLFESAVTLREALNYFTRYFSVQSPFISINVDEYEDTAEWSFFCIIPRLSHKRQMSEHSLAMMLKLINLALDRHVSLMGIRVAALPPTRAHPSVVDDTFRCTCLFNQATNSLLFQRELLDETLPRNNRWLLELLSEQLELNSFDKTMTLEEQIDRLLITLLPIGKGRLKVCARYLGMSPRSLQARLAERTTSFSAILNQRRAMMAASYLRDTTTALEAVASNLGYADQATFTRAFARTHGISPAKYRKLHRMAAR